MNQKSNNNLFGKLSLLQQFPSLGVVAGQLNQASRNLPPTVQTGTALQVMSLRYVIQ